MLYPEEEPIIETDGPSIVGAQVEEISRGSRSLLEPFYENEQTGGAGGAPFVEVREDFMEDL